MRALMLGLALVLGLLGCTSEPDGWDVPANGPHEAYVDRVLGELSEIHATTLERFAREREIDATVVSRLEATFTTEEAQHRRAGLENVLANDLQGFAGTGGPRPIAVRSLPRVGSGCVLAEVDVTMPSGAGAVEPPPEAAVVVELREAEVDESTNPTGWVIAREELVPDGDLESVSACS